MWCIVLTVCVPAERVNVIIERERVSTSVKVCGLAGESGRSQRTGV